ncbi:substrate-binding periplasmic protein [Fluviispira multicolorata]|uniref:Transporter substrate-binding domain-containing protein n=1 Tax=Fluviispira multicolorata TaxID=2654512 RepID=A0A833JF58_9BACT|nr:transporter substrate-binding domain-containing protein [Fluviispira multicolorata]KAB8033561.1 transporter substrate-binding domain-containing protein [Fluviispira multicolorata]
MRTILVIVFLIYTQLSFADGEKTLIVGFFNNRPFSYIEKQTGKESGIIIDFLKKKILKFDNIKINYQQYPLSRVLKEVSNNSIDIVAILGKNPEREKLIYFSETPIYSTYNYLMVLSNSKLVKIESIQDLKKETIGIVQNSAYCDFIKLNKHLLHIDETANENFIPIQVNKLLHKRITAAYAFLPEALYFEAKMMGIASSVRMVKIPDKKVSVYMAFSKKLSKNIRVKIEENLKKYHIEQLEMK